MGQQLSADQRATVNDLQHEFADVCSSTPGRTDWMEHVIRLTNDAPVYQPPYKVPDAIRDELENEIKEMLRLDIIK